MKLLRICLYITLCLTPLLLTACMQNSNSSSKQEQNQTDEQNEKTSSKQLSRTNKNSSSKVEPQIQIGKVEATEMDAAISVDAKMSNIPESTKVKGVWKFSIPNVGSSTSVQCNADNKSCVSYFSQDKVKPGKQYLFVVEFQGNINGQDAYLKEQKNFTVPQPYN